jgi:hypothetical protein
MKCETKAKRRATLSICGMGILDETEVDDIPANQKAPVERPRVPSPSDAVPAPKAIAAPRQADPEPSQDGPHKIIGGTYAEWAANYFEAIGTAGDPSVVMAWIDANQPQLAKLAKGSPIDAARVNAATDAHLAFLRRTDPISSGLEHHGEVLADMGGNTEPAPVKATRGRPKGSKSAPDFDRDYDGWIKAQLETIAAVQNPELLETIFEQLDSRWPDLFPADREILLGARRQAEARFEQ